MSQEKLDKIIDIIDVPMLHMVAIGITFTDIENVLKVASLILAIGYTAWKWRDEYKKRNEKTNNPNPANKRGVFKKS